MTYKEKYQFLPELPMTVTTEIERRDRAIIAFTILMGARDGATASLKLKHIY